MLAKYELTCAGSPYSGTPVPAGRLPAGQQTFVVRADPDDKLVEDDETNNGVSCSVYVPAPDFRITGFYTQPATLTAGQRYLLHVKTTNRGELTAAPRVYLFRTWANAPPLPIMLAAKTVAPGAIVIYSHEVPGTEVTSGTFTWKALVDPGKQFIEHNEADTDNARSLSVTIP